MLRKATSGRPRAANEMLASRFMSARGDQARAVVFRALRTPMVQALARSLVTPRTLDDYLTLLNPLWSLDEIRARVVGITREAPDVTSLLLKPSGNWRPHVAGQHVLFTADVEGIRRTRSFSLSRAPDGGGLLRVTIKAHANGCVSLWARDQAGVGDVVTLSPAQGDFILPNPAPDKLLFVSGGSGITPLVAMAEQLARDAYDGDLCWIHCERAEIPLESDMRRFSSALKQASLNVYRDAERYVTQEQITAWAPDWAEREAFVCGPLGLMELIESRYREQGRANQVHSEDYQPRLCALAPESSKRAGSGLLTFIRSGRTAESRPGLSLLMQAERAGLHPAHGCRRGICHTCKCRKLSGTVRNDVTGEVNSETNQEIQLCIHSPLGNVSLDL